MFLLDRRETHMPPGLGMQVRHRLKSALRDQLRRQEWYRRWYGERYLRERYKKLFSKDLDLDSLNTFSEKLFGRMITVNRNGNAIFTRLADKYLVRDYVREKVGEQHLTRLLWQGTSPFDIPFDTLPEKCILKTNHGSGYIMVVDGKTERKKIIEALQTWLKLNYYWNCFEYHYFGISPRILVEEFIDGGEMDWPLDYRFWCFNGAPEFIQVGDHSKVLHSFYDPSWNKLELCYRDRAVTEDIPKPKHFDRMVTVASELSRDFDFVRVDLYNPNGQTFFGELTFTPRAGMLHFKPELWDLKLGQIWRN
jgi:hypothetical protein